MRIVHCVRSPIGGIFRHVVDLALAQTAAGHLVGVVCDSLSGGAFEEELIERVAPRLAFGIARFPMRRALSPADVAATWRLWSHVASLLPDVLHGHGSKGGSFARLTGTALRLRGHRTIRIYCPHGGSLHFDARSLEGRVYFTLERVLERMTDGLVFVSDYERRSYEAKVGHPIVPSVLAYNGLRPEEFEPLEPTADAVDFLHVGMLREIKGTDVFLRALALLRDRGVEARALIVGGGEERPAFEALARDLGLVDRVTFRDPMPIREALASARVVVQPSRAESLPYVVLETLAAGVPLITTAVGGIPEIYQDHAERLLPSGDVEALAVAMRDHLRDPAAGAALGATLRRSLVERFSCETMARTIVAFYEQLRDPSWARPAAGNPSIGHDLRRAPFTSPLPETTFDQGPPGRTGEKR